MGRRVQFIVKAVFGLTEKHGRHTIRSCNEIERPSVEILPIVHRVSVTPLPDCRLVRHAYPELMVSNNEYLVRGTMISLMTKVVGEETHFDYTNTDIDSNTEPEQKVVQTIGVEMNKPVQQPNDYNMVYSTYGLHDWLVNRFHQQVFCNSDRSMIIERVTWIVGARFNMSNFIAKLGFEVGKSTFTSRSSAIVVSVDGGIMVELSLDGMKLHIQVHAEKEQVESIIADIDARHPRMQSTIHWVYGTHGQTSEVPLNFKPAIDEFYPFINQPIEDFFDAYLNSDEAVLILIGPPGTGKTTFIKNLLNFGKSDALVTFDPAIMASDSLFARFIDESEIDFLVMEDADAFLKSRADGNQMMHKFLNVSDGLISTRGKKLIFSTNLPSINDIDEALLRPGRCFRVIEFRHLTKVEAEAISQKMPVTFVPGVENYTLAELMSSRTVEQKQAVASSTRSVGFY